MIEFRLVDIGEGLTQAEIVRWLVAVGDRVSEDEPVVEIETDKAVVEMPAPATGTVVALGGDAGDIVAVGEILVVIDDGSSDEGKPDEGNLDEGQSAAAAAEPETVAPTPSILSSTPPPPSDEPSTRPLATPSTRALARRLGVDLATIRGRGPGGRIMDDDVTAAANAPAVAALPGPVEQPIPSIASEAAAPSAGTRVPLRGIRKRTAETMTAAWQTVPHVDSFHEIDVTDLFSLREQFNAAAAGGQTVSMTACFVKATALALADHPMLNASIDTTAGEIALHADRHIGVAVDTPDGLVLPVVRHADQRSLPDIAGELAVLGAAAAARRLTPAQMSGATFTVSNHGVFGGWFGTSLVHGNEVGIAGFGPARRRPEFDAEGRVVPRRILVINLAADHRVVDGRDIISFGMAIRRRLEAPLTLFLGAP